MRPTSPRFAVVVLTVVGLLVSARVVPAATLRVPADYATINAAITAASAGDTVLVAAGTYTDFETRPFPNGSVSSVAFLKGGVTLLSESGPESTILRLDSTVAFPRVVYANAQTDRVTLSGFTVTSPLPGIGGASFTWDDLGVVEDCIFRDMGTGQSGEFALGSTNGDLEARRCQFFNIHGGSPTGGSNGDLLFEDCHFENCSSGAMVITEGLDTQPTTLVLRRSTFIGNTKTTGGGGGCFVLCDGALVEDCWFENNSSLGNGSAGGGIALVHGNSILRGSTFVGNVVTGNGVGGGAIVMGQSSVSMNTFHSNGQVLTVYGGAALASWGTASLSNNVFSGSPEDVAAIRRMSGTLTTSCNVFWDNPGGEADNFVLDATDLIADPLYCGPEQGDFTVSSQSPCLPENSNGCGLIGAWGQGCGTVAVEPGSWARIKARYRGDRE